MLEAIRQKALKQLWCAPSQDNHAIIVPSKISSVGGVRESITFSWERIKLPTTDVNYHVYSLGQTNPTRLALPNQKNVWFNLAEYCTQTNTIIDLYNTDGVMVPRGACYIQQTTGRNYVLAVRSQTLPFDLDTQAIYYRVYQNYFYRLGGYQGQTGVALQSAVMATTAQIGSYIDKLNQYKDRGVHKVRAFRNGRLTNSFSLQSVRIGDHLEIVFDDSIEQVVDLPISDMLTFTSELDDTQKYLAYLNKEEDNPVRFYDDVDLYVCNTDGSIDGVYYHRNQRDSVRMVTHRCYSLPTIKVNAYLNDNPHWGGSQNQFIRLYVRQSYPTKTLTYERNRIMELYKLPDTVIKQAMVDINSTVEQWRASALENSPYCLSLGKESYRDFMATDFLHLYGYFGLGKLINDNPIPVTDDLMELPLASQVESTIFEYSDSGELLDYQYHNAGITYLRKHVDTARIETIASRGSATGGLLLNNPTFTLKDGVNYRFYVALINDQGEAVEAWQDVTGVEGYYSISSDNVVSWDIDTSLYQGVVLHDNEFLLYSFEYEIIDNVIDFSLLYNQVEGQHPVISHQYIDIFLNGKLLIPDIDYHIEFPRVVVYNQEYWVPGNIQSFVIRGRGLPDSPNGPIIPTETGFVNNGKVSVDGQYNLRDDRVIYTVVDGGMLDDTQVAFSEDPNSMNVAGVENGRPYMIMPMEVPRRGLTEYPASEERQQALAMDEKVAAYLQGHYPQTPPEINPISGKYEIYSPFVAKLIHEFEQGNLTAPSGNIPAQQVTNMLRHFIDLLDFDPCRNADLDLNYVAIHPHPFSMTKSVSAEQYQFIERIIAMYLNDSVDLTQFLTISVN